MARIYFVLALFAITLLVTNIVLGLSGGDVNAVSREYQQALATLQDLTRKKDMDHPVESQLAEARSTCDRIKERYQPIHSGQTLHFLLGLLAALVTC